MTDALISTSDPLTVPHQLTRPRSLLCRCRHCLGPSSVPALSAALPSLSNLVRLDLAGNELGVWGLTKLCEVRRCLTGKGFVAQACVGAPLNTSRSESVIWGCSYWALPL